MRKLWMLPVLLMLLAPITAAAQESESSSLDLGHMLCDHQGPTATGETGLFTLRSGHTLCKGQWAFSTYYNLFTRRMDGIPGRDPLWNDWDYEEDRFSLAFAYGVSDRFEIAVSVPYIGYDANGFEGVDAFGHPLEQGGRINGRTFIRNVDASGIGDVRVAGKFQIAERGDYGMIFNAFVDLPTGDDDEGVVTGELGFGLGFGWSKGDWVFNLGYSDPGEPDFGETSGQVDLGIGYARSLTERFDWITELVGAIKTEGDETHDEADITTGGRVRFGETGNWAFNFGVRVDLSDDDIGDNYTPIGGLVGLTWSPKRSRQLTTEVAGECRGTVTTDPAGAICDGSAASAQGCGKEVRLTATPEGDCCEFDSWSGDCSGIDPVTGVMMDGDRHCVASFRKKGPYDLDVKVMVSGDCDASGTVTSRPAGIDCGGTCGAAFECGQEVMLSAMPVEGKTEFTGWSGDCRDGKVTMDGDKSCTANFKCLPPPPPEQKLITCEKPTKKSRQRWPCDGSREIVHFDGGSAFLGDEQQTKLCDLVAQIEHCSAVKACIAGRSAASENSALAGQRADAVSQYLAHQGVSADRFAVSPECKAPSESGSWADIYLEP